MKHSLDTYRFYDTEKLIHTVMRIVVTMKERVDAEILEKAANEAIVRYPYFSVKVILDKEESYNLIPNTKRVVVLPIGKKAREFATDEVNEHLCFLEYEDNMIYFNLSHVISGGKGAQPWVMTTVYQYIKDKYKVELNCPGIRKIDEGLLEGEVEEPSIEMLSGEPPIYVKPNNHAPVMKSDYLNGLFNPFMRKPNYTLFEFKQSDIIRFAKNNDSSVVSLFIITIAKMLDKVLPDKYPVIGGETAHNPAEDIGLPYSHHDLQSLIFVDYKREYFKWDMDKIGTITRGQIISQIDSTISQDNMKRVWSIYSELDNVEGLKNKQKFLSKNSPSRSKDAKHSTFVCNYSGFVDWGEAVDYIDEYYYLVDGHLVFEITSLGDKIFLSMMMLIKKEKYIRELCNVFDELKLPYKLKGPFPRPLPRHRLPKKISE